MAGKPVARLCFCCAVALAVPPPSAALAAKPATVGKAPYYLRAADGRQCTLPSGASGPIADETARLRQAGISVESLAVSFAVGAEWLPLGCLPKDVDGFWKKHPEARAGVKQSGGIVCEACGCPETWFYCVASTSKAELLSKAGYAKVR
jgi:hypothetical protein